MSETALTTTPNHEVPSELTPAHQGLSQLALEGVGVAAQHFHGAGDNSMHVTQLGEHRLVVIKPGEADSIADQVVGVGYDADTALKDSLKLMRSLETVKTKSLVRLEMTDQAAVDFTELTHYSPRVAPSRETHPIPDYLKELVTDNSGIDTYENTVAQEGWQAEVRSVVEDYLATPAGRQLADSLKIKSLDHLTPEQAVKLSAALVQDVSKYSYADVGVKTKTRADLATTPELLKEGMAKKGDPNWQGNGVCRNIAANMKAVFEALKSTQGELSMLNNTYVVSTTGMGGEGYDDKREDSSTYNLDIIGHAWDTFVTVDSKGSAAATIVDATWALGRDANKALDLLDRTEARATAQLIKLFAKSELKPQAFDSISHFLDNLIRHNEANRRLSPGQREGARDYAITQYLRLAGQLTEIPEGYYMPDVFMSAAYRMRGKLDKSEISTLFKLDKARGGADHRSLANVIKGYDKDRPASLPAWKLGKNLVFKDDELQALVFDAIDEPRLLELAESSGALRARMREQRPEVLPPFDPYAREADASEMRELALAAGINENGPKWILRAMHQRLERLTGDAALIQEVTAGLSDYDLAKNFGDIVKTLKQKASS